MSAAVSSIVAISVLAAGLAVWAVVLEVKRARRAPLPMPKVRR